MKKLGELALVLVCCALLFYRFAPAPHPSPSGSPTPSAAAATIQAATAPVELSRCPHKCTSPSAQELFLTYSEEDTPAHQIVVLDKVLALEPASAAANFHRAAALIELKRYPEAVASAGRALEVQPGFAQALNTRAWARHFSDDVHELEMGLTESSQAIQLQDTPTFYDTRGCLLLKLGRTQEALLDFGVAIRREPSAEHLRHRAGALRLLGRTSEAAQDEARAGEK